MITDLFECLPGTSLIPSTSTGGRVSCSFIFGVFEHTVDETLEEQKKEVTTGANPVDSKT